MSFISLSDINSFLPNSLKHALSCCNGCSFIPLHGLGKTNDDPLQMESVYLRWRNQAHWKRKLVDPKASNDPPMTEFEVSAKTAVSVFSLQKYQPQRCPTPFNEIMPYLLRTSVGDDFRRLRVKWKDCSRPFNDLLSCCCFGRESFNNSDHGSFLQQLIVETLSLLMTNKENFASLNDSNFRGIICAV